MEWLRYTNVFENTFGLGSRDNEQSSSTRQATQSSEIHSSAGNNIEKGQPMDSISSSSTVRISSQDSSSLACPTDSERELQHYAYRSSGLLDSFHNLFGTTNHNNRHPNNPIEDMRLSPSKQDDNDNHSPTDHFKQREFPSVITHSSSDDSSFYCNSFTDEDEFSVIQYPTPPTKQDEVILNMEEGKDIPTTSSLKRRGIVMSKERFEELAAKNERHFRPFGHGKFWTCLSLFVAWSGVLCAVSSAHSVRFVRLQKPIPITPMYFPVERMGLLRTEICLNATAAGMDACKIIPIDSEDIHDDNKFGMARLFLMLGTVFGVFFTLLLSTSVYWESINLRPVAAGFLLSYFFQSLSMLFFDTEVCATNKCRVDHGCVLSILAALGWIVTCIATSKMDTFKIVARRQRRRHLRQRLRDEYKRELAHKNYIRETSTATETTYVSQQSNSSSDSSVELNGIEVEERKGELNLIKITSYPKRCQSNDRRKRSNPPPTIVKVVGIDPTDLHEC